MAKIKVKKGDQVLVITGKDKGKKGLVLKSLPAEGRLLVEGVNVKHKKLKPTAENPQASSMSLEYPIHISNVMHLDPKTGTRTRVGYRINPDGTKVRISRKTQEEV
jgi:large subunit ribosomal protein L24